MKKIDGLRIKYQNKSINNLSVGRIALWNKGRETIRKEDIAENNRLRIITLNDTKILEAKIIFQKNKANNFSLVQSKKNNEINIKFDFFDIGEGIIIQVFHTGKNKSDIDLGGFIKGSGEIKKMDLPLIVKLIKSSMFLDNQYVKYKKGILGFILIITPIILLLSYFIPNNPHPNPALRYIFLIITFVLYWSLAYAILSKRIPRGFELYEDVDNIVVINNNKTFK